MEYYINQIDNATDIDALTEIVEERAAFDETSSNDEYCKIAAYAIEKIKSWRN